MKTTHTLARKSYQPVIIQPRIANARPATRVMIDTYMADLGFEKTSQEGRFNVEGDILSNTPELRNGGIRTLTTNILY